MKTATATKIKKDGSPDLRHAKRIEHLDMLAPFLAKPRTVEECAEKLGTGIRAVYFLFDALEEQGRTVARIGPKAGGRYVLMVPPS